jgi:hypothetical protein
MAGVGRRAESRPPSRETAAIAWSGAGAGTHVDAGPVTPFCAYPSSGQKVQWRRLPPADSPQALKAVESAGGGWIGPGPGSTDLLSPS